MLSSTSLVPVSLLSASFSTDSLDPGTRNSSNTSYVPGTELGLEERPSAKTYMLLVAAGTEIFNSTKKCTVRHCGGEVKGICIVFVW